MPPVKSNLKFGSHIFCICGYIISQSTVPKQNVYALYNKWILMDGKKEIHKWKFMRIIYVSIALVSEM